MLAGGYCFGATCGSVRLWVRTPKMFRFVSSNKNLAIANRSRVSCTHNTSRASMKIRDLEILVKGHSRSLETEPLSRSHTTYYYSSYLTLNNIVTLKSGLEVTQGH